MFNLLSVVVAVAISGFMAAAGVFYSGSAFTNMSAKAQAIQILSAMEQIDAAWTMWSNDGNTTTAVLPLAATLTSASPPYLSSFPPPPTSAAATFGASGTNAYWVDSTGTGGAAAGATESTNTGIFVVLNSTTGANACLEMAKSAGYVASTASSFTGLGAVTVNGVSVAVSGITTKAEFDALGAVYRYFCVPLGTTTTVIALGSVANTIAIGGDTGKHVAYFKHM